MKLGEVFHTCSNPGVAEAASLSMGGVVAARVGAAAKRRCVPPGDLVVTLVPQPMLDRLAS